MKILLLNLWRVIDSKGGTEKVFFNMSNELTRRGNKVVSVGLQNKVGRPSFPVDSNVNFINVGVGFTGRMNFFDKLKRILAGNHLRRHIFDAGFMDYKRGELIRPVIEKENPDIIISFNAMATRILKFNLKVDKPVITMFHFDPDTILKDASIETIRALELSNCIQCLLPSYIDVIKNYLEHSNIVSIGNVVPYIECRLQKNSNKIINVGRFDKNQKRQDILIEAFNRINTEFADWNVEFWGQLDGDQESIEYVNYCKMLVKKYGLEKRITFCGVTDNIIEVLKRSAIFACTSSFEGFGLALTEAMSAGLAVIGFKNAPGVSDLIDNNKNGVLCDNSIESFTSSLAELMKDADKRKMYGLQAKEDMRQYSSDKIWDAWELLINKTVSEFHNEGKV